MPKVKVALLGVGNCASSFIHGIKVAKGPLLDGVGNSTKALIEVSNAVDVDVAKTLKVAGAEVVINLLPSGAAVASLFYAEQALAAGCAFVTATPNFIARDKLWAEKFTKAKLPP